jgi:hypothetical protein
MPKRGITIPWNFDPEDFALYKSAIDSGKISWLSNWEMWKPEGLPSNITYVPQVRTAKEAGSIKAYLDGYAHDHTVQEFMSFNEPDIKSQANMSASQAVEYWRTYVLPNQNRFKLGSPSISNGPNGVPWLDDFLQNFGSEADSSAGDTWKHLEESRVDYIVIHWYGTDVNCLKKYVRSVHERYDRPVWVTEFSCTSWDIAKPPTENDVLEFMKDALRFLDNAAFVQRYAWFGAMEDVGEAVGRANGLQKDGQLTEAGKLYCTL